jgi:penicillin-binding protein 1A
MAVTTRNVRSGSPADASQGAWDGEASTRPPLSRSGGGPGQGGGRGGRSGGGGPSGQHPVKRRSFIWRWRRAFFLLALLGLAGVAAGGAVLAQTELPEVTELQQTSFICAAGLPEGEPCNPQNAMAKLSSQDRVNVTYEQLSPHIINAVVAMEDRNFFEHDGVAPLAIARALYRDLRGDAIQQGGSTITQQYVKNAFLTPERALTRKIKEAILSIKLEQRMSKEEILEGYLNTIYFGRGAYGIQAAGQNYFGKDVSELGVAESAYLAGLIRAPSLADATDHPEEAVRRRQTALDAMLEEGYITEDEAAIAEAQPFEEPWFRPRQEFSEVQVTQGGTIGGDYITAYVRWLLTQPPFEFEESQIVGGGLRVYTSIDMELQARAWQAVNGVLNQPEDPAAGLVAVDEQGLIRAMVGGRNFQESQVNHAVRMGTRGRPVGSTYKPIALARAVVEGWSLESRYDAPAEKTIDQTPLGPESGCLPEWTPHNYAESEGGQLDLMEATAQSSNTAYAQLMMDLGPQNVIDMGTALGMPNEEGVACPPVVLGTENASPLDMATVYSTFANQGMRHDPSIITKVERVDEEGDVTTLFEWAPNGHQVMTDRQANLVTHALQGVIDHGTGTRANIGIPAAGKTGTTSDNKDAWFVGYVPRLTAAVWIGYPNADWVDPETGEESIPPMNSRGRPVHGGAVTGGSLPAQVWHDFMLSATQLYGMNDQFPEVTPDDIANGRRLEELHEDDPGADDGDGSSGTPDSTMTPPQGPGNPGNPGGPDVTRPGNGNTTTTSTTTSTTSTTMPDTTLPPPTSATTTTLPIEPDDPRPGRP